MGNNADGFGKVIQDVVKKLGPLAGVLDAVTAAWGLFVSMIGTAKTAITPFLANVVNIIGDFGQSVADAIKHTDMSAVFDAVQTTLIGGIFLALRKGLTGGGSFINIDFGGKVIKNLSDTLGGLTTNLKAMQRQVQATTLLAIAASIVVLAGGVALLASIDPKKLTKAMTAVAVGLGELVAALFLLGKANLGTVSIGLISLALLALSTSLVILAAAMKIFATMSWEDLVKGLVGVAGALAAVGVGSKLIGPQTILAAASLIPLAIAINILAAAVKSFAELSWQNLAKGLLGVAGAIALIGAALDVVPASILLIGPGMIALAM